MTRREESRRRFEWGGLLIICAVAVLLRGGALWGWFAHLSQDRDDYLTVARQYLAHGFWKPFEHYPNSFRPPLYPLVLALILKGGGGVLAIGLFQLVVGTATVALTSAVARRIGLGSWSLGAAALVALDPLLIDYTTFPMTETLVTFLTLLLVYVSLPSEKPVNAGTTGLPWVGRAVLCGIVFGACALCRPTIWPMPALVALTTLVRERKNFRALGRLVPSVAAAVAGTALVVAPWVVRNELILGSPVLTTTHGGYTLLLGNNRDFYHEVVDRPLSAFWRDRSPDRFQKPWLQKVTAEMEAEIGVQADEIARDRWMYRCAVRSMREEPRLFLRACLFRMAEFWSIVPLGPSRSAIPGLLVWGASAAYAIELALFVAGLISLAGAWDRRWTIVILILVDFSAVQMLYWTNLRMRAPLMPLIALLAVRPLMLAWSRFGRSGMGPGAVVTQIINHELPMI